MYKLQVGPLWCASPTDFRAYFNTGFHLINNITGIAKQLWNASNGAYQISNIHSLSIHSMRAQIELNHIQNKQKRSGSTVGDNN